VSVDVFDYRSFRLQFSNSTSAPLHVSATPVTPSKIVPVDLAQHYGITIAKGAYFAITGPDIRLGTKIVSNPLHVFDSRCELEERISVCPLFCASEN
jgi:uncharacterized protein (AIM24 family)